MLMMVSELQRWMKEFNNSEIVDYLVDEIRLELRAMLN